MNTEARRKVLHKRAVTSYRSGQAETWVTCLAATTLDLHNSLLYTEHVMGCCVVELPPKSCESANRTSTHDRMIGNSQGRGFLAMDITMEKSTRSIIGQIIAISSLPPNLDSDSFFWTHGTIGGVMDGKIKTRRCVIYMVSEGQDGEILYIGSTNYWATTRLKQHKQDKKSLFGAAMREDMVKVREWRISIVTMPDQETARVVEAGYINNYRPKFNRKMRG